MNKVKKSDEETTEAETKTKAQETETETTKAQDDMEETTKSVSRGEFNELVKAVGELGNSFTQVLGKMVKAISVGAHDQNQPSKEKMDDPDGDKDVVKSDVDAVDQRNPDEKKKMPPDGHTDMTKSAERPESQDEANGTDENGGREKSSKKKSKEGDETYDLTTVQRAIKRIEEVGKAMDTTEETETKKTADETRETETTKARKAADDTTEERTTKSSMSDVDKLAVTMAHAFERMEKSLKDQGFQTEHLVKSKVEELRADTVFQENLREMIRQPGTKKSVVTGGRAFIKMRDGRQYEITANAVHPKERTQKSADGKSLTFKQMWARDLASVSNEEE